MVEFIDKTTEQAGTPINRKNLMAIQGFVAETTVFNEAGTITKTNGNGETLTITFNIDGTITKVFMGSKTITMTIAFNDDGSITKTIN